MCVTTGPFAWSAHMCRSELHNASQQQCFHTSVRSLQPRSFPVPPVIIPSSGSPRLRARAPSPTSRSTPRRAHGSATQHSSFSTSSDPAAGRRARVLNGREVASSWLEDIRSEVEDLKKSAGCEPGLAVVLAGERPDSLLYVKRKQEACEYVGINFVLTQLPADCTQEEMQEAVQAACRQGGMHGVLVQLPLPAHLDEAAVLDCISVAKDVDGIHPLNMGRLALRGYQPTFIPCTPLGCMKLLESGGVAVRGARCVVLGDSNIVGLPLSALLRDQGAASVTVCHSSSLHQEAMHSQLAAIARSADILVSAVGMPELVTEEWVQAGAVVLDVGINRLPAVEAAQRAAAGCPEAAAAAGPGLPLFLRRTPFLSAPARRDLLACHVSAPADRLAPREQRASCSLSGGEAEAGEEVDLDQIVVIGDVAFEKVSKVASAISPVPGGIGPMTIASLMSNTVLATKMALDASGVYKCPGSHCRT